MQSAANAGITQSESRYVVIHDDDDTWDPNFLECTTAHLEQARTMGVATSTDLVTEQVEGEKISTLETSRMFPRMRAISIYRMCYENQFAPIAFVFRRQVFEDIGYFDQNLRGYGDWDFHLRFLERYDVDYLDTPAALAFYHQRPEAVGDQRNSVFSDDQQFLADRMFNKWLRADLERGHVGLGYIVNALHNGPFDAGAAFSAVMARIDERADQVVNTLSKQIEERADQVLNTLSKQIEERADQLVNTLSQQIEENSGSVSGTVIESSMRLEDVMGRQHHGLIPISHRILQRLRRPSLSRQKDNGR